MTGHPFNRPRARAALALLVALPLMGLGADRVEARAGGVVWLKVEVDETRHADARVKINVPISLVEVVIDSIDRRELLSKFEENHHGLNIRKLWREVRDMRSDDFVTVETEDESIRVWKDRDFFRITVREGRRGRSSVDMTIPLDVMDYLLDARGSRFSFQEVVDRMRGYLPLTLIQVDEEGESVRVWLEEE